MLGSVGSVEIFEAFNVAIKGVRSWLLGSICNKSILGRIFPSPFGNLGGGTVLCVLPVGGCLSFSCHGYLWL